MRAYAGIWGQGNASGLMASLHVKLGFQKSLRFRTGCVDGALMFGLGMRLMFQDPPPFTFIVTFHNL